MLRDEPDWEGEVGIVKIEFGWEEAVIEPIRP